MARIRIGPNLNCEKSEKTPLATKCCGWGKKKRPWSLPTNTGQTLHSSNITCASSHYRGLGSCFITSAIWLIASGQWLTELECVNGFNHESNRFLRMFQEFQWHHHGAESESQKRTEIATCVRASQNWLDHQSYVLLSTKWPASGSWPQ